ncbi:helix-turn-helix domain-containing protein [Embleya sp. NPDC001921]
MRKEVRRVLAAVDDLEKIPDAGERAKALGELLLEIPSFHSKVREMRQQAVLVLRQQGLSWQDIGDLLGVGRSRAKRIAEGTSWPAKNAAPPDESTPT